MWITFSLLAAVSYAGVNIIDKFIISRKNINRFALIFLFCCMDLMIGLTLYFSLGIHFSPKLIFGMLAGFSIPLTEIFYFKAIKEEEITRVIPWFEFSILLTAVGATIFLNVALSLKQYLGIIVLLAGLIALTAKKGFGLKIDKWVLTMIIASAIYATATLLEKYLLNGLNPFHLYSVFLIGSFLGYLPFALIKKQEITEGLKTKNWPVISLLFSEFFGIGAMLLGILALNQGLATLVTVLISSQHIFLLAGTILISLFYPAIIKEDLKGEVIGLKFIAIIAIIFGIYLTTF
jgi:uncharacterized membrane protein